MHHRNRRVKNKAHQKGGHSSRECTAATGVPILKPIRRVATPAGSVPPPPAPQDQSPPEGWPLLLGVHCRHRQSYYVKTKAHQKGGHSTSYRAIRNPTPPVPTVYPPSSRLLLVAPGDRMALNTSPLPTSPRAFRGRCYRTSSPCFCTRRMTRRMTARGSARRFKQRFSTLSTDTIYAQVMIRH